MDGIAQVHVCINTVHMEYILSVSASVYTHQQSTIKEYTPLGTCGGGGRQYPVLYSVRICSTQHANVDHETQQYSTPGTYILMPKYATCITHFNKETV